MDSLTQFALGAGVGLAVLGRRVGPRRAALAGGILGTLPDLDVLYPFKDPVDAFVLHRGPTHSLIVQAVATPLFGEALMRLQGPLRRQRALTYAAVYLCFATHALLDALTVYGTRIFWPLWPEPVGIGSVFIIDPLYTVPLLIAVVWALCLRSWTARFRVGLVVCLGVSSVYLGWGLIAQRMAEARATAVLAERGVEPDRLLATPTPFNSLLWRAIAIEGSRYFNVYVPLLAPRAAATVYAHPHGTGRIGCIEGIPSATRVARFSKGFYRLDVEDGEVVVSDLRMGLTPNYVFRFAVAEVGEGELVAVPPRRVRGLRSADGDLDWLLAGLLGGEAVRLAEAATAEVDAPRRADASGDAQPLC
ncbi:MAG TPA: metal-dependent hydrolase [Geminicoccaceae bacterium]